MWLLIDDVRDSLGCDVVARNSIGAKAVLEKCSFEGLCLDHDLGHDQTGYDVLVWALEQGHVPPIVELVTSNPVGRERMGAALVAAGWVKKSPIKYIKRGHEYAE